MSALVRRFVSEEEGEEAVEYALLVSLVFLAVVGAVTLFASNATAMWTELSTHI